MTEELSELVIGTHKFTVDDYHKMGAAGVFDDHKVELINGKIVDMSPINSNHGGAVNRIVLFLRRYLSLDLLFSVQNPIHINEFSEPEPDVAILKQKEDCYSNAHPIPEEVLLIMEVSDTSLQKDKEVKLPLYAEVGIPEVWIVNLQDKQIEQYTTPTTKGYTSMKIYHPGDFISNTIIEKLPVADIIQ
jgi:Uma2 family endonuclease